MACAYGHVDVARWLVTEVGIDARSERSNVCTPFVDWSSSHRCSVIDGNGACLVVCGTTGWFDGPFGGVRQWLPRCGAVAGEGCRVRCSVGAGQSTVLGSAPLRRCCSHAAVDHLSLDAPQNGRTALDRACMEGYWSVARWLIDERDVDWVGQTLL